MPGLRIGFLVYDFASHHSGGIATYAHNMATFLHRDGHHVEVLTGRGPSNSRLPYKVTELTQSQERLGRLELSRRFADVLQSRKHEFDLVEATDWGMEGYFCLKHSLTPCIIRFHTPNSMVERLNGCTFRRDSLSVNGMEREYFGLGRYFSAPSLAMISAIERYYPLNHWIAHLPNPIDPELSEMQVCENNTVAIQSHCIGFMGRLERRKGVYALAEALAILLLENPRLEFHFAGPDTRTNRGSVGKELLGILRPTQEQVRFLGYLDRESRTRFLSHLRFCVLPSLWENAPYVCIEAMVSGVDLIVTAGSGFEELVDVDPRVIFAEPGDSSSLLEAMRRKLLTDPSRIRYPAIQKFSWENLRDPTLRFYQRVAADIKN